MKTLILLLLPFLTIAQPCKQAIHLAGAMAFGGPLKADSIYIDVDSVANITMSARVFVIEAGTTLWPLTKLEIGGCTIADAVYDSSEFHIQGDSMYGPIDPWDTMGVPDYYLGAVIPSHNVLSWYQSEADPASPGSSWGIASGGSYFTDKAKWICHYNYRATAWVGNVLHVSNIIQRKCEYIWNPRPTTND